MNLGGVQLIPTATTFLQDSAMDAHSRMESPLTTFTPSLELKENHAGIFMSSSSKISAKACINIKLATQNQEVKHHNYAKILILNKAQHPPTHTLLQ